MRFSVSTVKDSPDNVDFFVRANLASGIDHMFIVLDRPGQPGQLELAEMLKDHPHVTCLRSGKSWWVTGRPAKLNVRQRINANWVRDVLAPFAWAEWLFHVDGDEVVRLDDDALAAVPDHATTVALAPLEAVSELEPAQRRPTRFKRLLDDEELNLLHVLGLVAEPSNQHYFHGHVMGKVGVRPGAPVALALHNSIPTDGSRGVAPHSDPRLALLHYDAVSGAEFIRKWEALATAGSPRFRPSRMPSARALTHLVTADLDPEVRHAYLRRIYEITTADDVSALSDLRLLETVDPVASERTPQPFPPGARDALAERVERLRTQEKRHLLVPDLPRGGPATRRGPRALLHSLRQRRDRAEADLDAVEDLD